MFDNGQISIKCATRSLGKVHDEISADINGTSMEIGFKCRFFPRPAKGGKRRKGKAAAWRKSAAYEDNTLKRRELHIPCAACKTAEGINFRGKILR